MSTAKEQAGSKTPEKATADGPDEKAATESTAKQAAEATLTEVQPPGAVSEVVTGTPERPESTRIVPSGEKPVSAQDTDPRPAEYREESQVAPTQVKGEQGQHGNADY